MSWCKLGEWTPSESIKVIAVRPKYRTYLRQSDAGYDWAAGRPFVVISNCEYQGQTIAVDEVYNLKRHGWTAIQIHYNTDRHMEMQL